MSAGATARPITAESLLAERDALAARLNTAVASDVPASAASQRPGETWRRSANHTVVAARRIEDTAGIWIEYRYDSDPNVHAVREADFLNMCKRTSEPEPNVGAPGQ